MSAVLAPTAPAAVTAPGPREDHSLAGTPRQGRIEMEYTEVPANVAENFVMAVGWDWQLPATVIDVLKAAAAELVDNAVTHALSHTAWPGGEHVVLVDVDLHLDRVVLAVRDPDPLLPSIPQPMSVEDMLAALEDPDVTPEDLENLPRGLYYLAGLCTALRPVAQPTGKAMIAEIALPGCLIGDAATAGARR
jgi:anti-sigma regulatory factor (Ser/Thr protein kinase)